MKIVVCGDLHGKSVWGQIDITQYDKVVFLGDYADDWTMPDSDIIINLHNIIELKKQNPDKVILLLGNHDYMYLYLNEPFRCSGFRASYANIVHEILKKEKDLFQVGYLIENYLFTHAGVSKQWYNNILAKSPYFEYMGGYNIAEKLNALLDTGDRKLLWDASSPLWIRPRNMGKDIIDGYHQVVGHTEIDKMIKEEYPNGSILYMDILNNGLEPEFYEIEL